MNEADEQEIETRLRAAFLARGELVTHQLLRPAVPPNEHTAGVTSGRRRWSLNWRTALVPVSIAAALVGGVFVGTTLPDGKSSHSYATGGGVTHTSADAPGNQVTTTDHGPLAQSPNGTQTAPQSTAPAPAKESTFGGLAFQPAGWQLAPLDDDSACLLPKDHDAPDKAAVLPCGVDALMIQADAAPDAWPLSTATAKEGWWPKAGGTTGGTNQSTAAPGGAVPCPAAKPSTKNLVKSSAPFRADDKYPLAGTTTADFREWTVTCADGSGAVPRLWLIKGTKTIAVTAVSVDARYDGTLLQIVASMRPATG